MVGALGGTELSSGVVLIGLSLVMLSRPTLLESLGSTLIVFGGAAAIAAAGFSSMGPCAVTHGRPAPFERGALNASIDLETF